MDNQMIFHKQSQAGVTLVELMIGLTIGLIVVGAAMAILFSNQTMLIQKQKVDRTQEELRFAITTIT
jgi:prepilin-type N-terminal cleavage/methylation domain-containing protein